jgi:hypothetical protein
MAMPPLFYAIFHVKARITACFLFISFARPKETNQRKGRPIAAFFLRVGIRFLSRQNGLHGHTAGGGVLPPPLRGS